ncbi:MAG: hypothetical protein O7F76_14120 [Planctomycetota bacterium]|nr:hypothetical protein [Planctomycetota bacterium]
MFSYGTVPPRCAYHALSDTAPYLHDGRALTLGQAILMHGGEAQPQRDAYAALPDADKAAILRFLRSLRTPRDPAKDIAARLRSDG